VLSTLVHWGRAICNQESLSGELEFLHSVFKQHGYSDRQIHCSLNPPCREDTPKEEPTLVAFLPSVGPTFNHIRRVLTRHKLKTVGPLPRKVTSILQTVKDDLDLKMAGIYSTSCKFGNVYIGQPGCSTETKIKDCHQYIRLYHLDR